MFTADACQGQTVGQWFTFQVV